MTESQAISLIKREIGGLYTNFTDPSDYLDAIDSSERDTGFSFSTSDSFQIKWLKERAKRALIYKLVLVNANKFRVKQIHLDQRFDHYLQLIKMMDEEFDKAQIENIFEFAQVESTQAFGHRISSGFAYDEFGTDITYDEDQLVGVSPGDN